MPRQPSTQPWRQFIADPERLAGEGKAPRTMFASGTQIFSLSNSSRLYIANKPVDHQANLIDLHLHFYKER